jgi:hypothetical protein
VKNLRTEKRCWVRVNDPSPLSGASSSFIRGQRLEIAGRHGRIGLRIMHLGESPPSPARRRRLCRSRRLLRAGRHLRCGLFG